MNDQPDLNAGPLLVLAIIELGPVSIDDTVAVWRYRCPSLPENNSRACFNAAVLHLLARGLVSSGRPGQLAITLAGRIALAEHCQFLEGETAMQLEM